MADFSESMHAQSPDFAAKHEYSRCTELFPEILGLPAIVHLSDKRKLHHKFQITRKFVSVFFRNSRNSGAFIATMMMVKLAFFDHGFLLSNN